MACLISCSEISLFTCTESGPTFIFKGVMFSEHIGAGVVFCWKRRLKKVCHSCTGILLLEVGVCRTEFISRQNTEEFLILEHSDRIFEFE